VGLPNCKDGPATLSKYDLYKITWTATKITGVDWSLSEIELPGMLEGECVSQTVKYEGRAVLIKNLEKIFLQN
jgi:hypothetical protein